MLVEPSDYVLRNFGDMAMLAGAVERLDEVLPDATIEVLTDEPDVLRAFCPTASALAGESRHLWLNRGFLKGSLNRYLPPRLANRLQRHIPDVLARSLERRLSERSRFVKSLKQADLLVVAGMGGITDYFPEYAAGVLRTMELALNLDRRVVMVGQGLGPLGSPALRELAGAILPRLDLIALREKRSGEPLLHKLGVDHHRIIVTGDDAVRSAYDLRIPGLGSGIGVNLRLTDYSAVDVDTARGVGETLRQVATARRAAVIPVPISRPPRAADIETLRMMLPDSEDELHAAAEISSISGIIRQIQRCRLVVTGSYHAGVFALANGIPAIGIAGSSYYVDKFEGLADMFGDGCEVVRLDSESRLAKLASAVERLWDMTDQLRPRLLNSAVEQIAANRVAYDRIANLLMNNRQTRSQDAPLQ